MRPLVLRMAAFGPYAEEERLDFRVLEGNPLFLIHGATGAGKTSILDAIAFALYGDSSGAERDGRSLRSDFASAERITSVELCFSLGERCFRVRRVPEQERAKKRGDGMTTQQAEATLWELQSPDDGPGNGKVLGTRWTQVTAKIEELLGFRSSQFRQVIMLPQGRFRELLTARSDQREAILEALFDTERFRLIQQALTERAKSLRGQVEKVGDRRRTLLEAAGFDDVEALQKARVALAAEMESGIAEIARLRTAATAAVQRLEEARQRRTIFDALTSARERLAFLERERQSIEETRQRVTRAQRAAGLIDLRHSCEEAGARLANAQAEKETAQAALEAARARLSATRARLAEVRGRRGQREAMVAELSGLEEQASRLAPLQQAQAELVAAEEALAQADEEWSTLVKEAADREESRQRTLERIEALKAAWSGSAPAEEQMEAARNTQDKWEELQRARARLEEEEKRLHDARVAEEAAATALESRRAQLHQLQSQQLPLLAATLADGEPCPVCGSREHPDPARGALELPIGEVAAIEPPELTAAEAALDEARAATAKAVAAAAACSAQVESLQSVLGDSADVTAADLEETRRLLLARLQEQEQAQRELTALQEQYKTIVDASQTRDGAAAAIEKKAALAREQRASAMTRVSEREATVPEAYRAPGAMEAAVDKLRSAIAEHDAVQQRVQDEHAEADRVAAAAHTADEAAARELRRANETGREAMTRWSARRKQAGFADDEAFEAALLGGEETERALRSIERFDADLREAEVRLRDAEAAAHGIDEPDLAAVARAAEVAQEQLGAAELDQGGRVERRRQLDETVSRIGKAATRLASLEADFADAGRVAAVAKGDNPYRMSFQRFVLAALLDDVLSSASQRLHAMSKGRYRLQRVTREGGRRRPGGLDLEVDDAYTGKTRAVTTLSGGEGFQAALALALGLADVVQAYAGGIRLDTMFIDEGFGSLDPEALELAIDTLVDLQASGRLIGVISHVPELRERIPFRLEVEAATVGSRARFAAAP